MRDITHCPNCQTQFFVSEDQLKQHGGLVRCGQCLHVFNAKEQFVSTNNDAQNNSKPNTANAPANKAISEASTHTNIDAKSSWPRIDLTVEEETLHTHQQQTQPEQLLPGNTTIAIQPAHIGAASERPHDTGSIAKHITNEVNEPAKPDQRDSKQSSNLSWPWAIGTLLLVLVATAQSAYFLRNSIAIYYPQLKPKLVYACEILQCSIALPKQIEWIVIDDSEMQEDLVHHGVIHLSTSLFNKATFVQAYPNLELTLTDTDDSPVLRRVFKPAEYLAPNTDIAAGFSAGNEVKVKLAISTQEINVAGYRLYVTY